MNAATWPDSFQLREIFHLEFLRWFGRKVPAASFAVKGGANLRFFFGSIRYSEDIDLDVAGVGVAVLKDTVMKIVEAPAFREGLKSFGIARIILPDISKAKQTETTQRFKIHLLTSAGEDLLSNVEFSRRGFKGRAEVGFVSEILLRGYGMPPLVAPHYDLNSAVGQKIEALATRSETQARDIFDLHLLSAQHRGGYNSDKALAAKIARAGERLFEVGFEKFRDTVLAYLIPEDRANYDSVALWDEIKLGVDRLLEEIKKENV
jgi:predicted nucleotidyltransferase component of viral defense system